MNYIPRNLEAVVKQVTEEYPVVLLTGPRQVGKTTMTERTMWCRSGSYDLCG